MHALHEVVENANSGDICQYLCLGASDHVRLLYLTLAHALMLMLMLMLMVKNIPYGG